MSLHFPYPSCVSRQISLPHLPTYSHLLCTVSVGQPYPLSLHPVLSELLFQAHSSNCDFLILMYFFHLFQGNFFSFHIILFLYAFETTFLLFACLLEPMDALREDFYLFVEQMYIPYLHLPFYYTEETIFCFGCFYGNCKVRRIFCSLNRSPMPLTHSLSSWKKGCSV